MKPEDVRVDILEIDNKTAAAITLGAAHDWTRNNREDPNRTIVLALVGIGFAILSLVPEEEDD